MTSATQHQGQWRRLANISADRKGSIHDDEAAQSLGFQGAFVPGSTVGTAAVPGIVALLGQSWLESGWCTFKFVAPVYTSNEVREEASLLPDGRVEVRVVTSEGRLCCSGQAGAGYEVPWVREEDGRHGSAVALPGVELGTRFDDAEMRVEVQYARSMLSAAGDQSPVYEAEAGEQARPAPPEALHNLALQATRSRRLDITGVRNPGMWADHRLAWKHALFLERPYLIREWVADKGLSGRTVYITYEFQVVDAAEVVAIGRHKVKWLRAEE